MKGFKWWATTVMVILVLIPGAASATGIEMSVGVWNQDPKGDLSFRALSVQDNLSIRDNLGFGDSTRVFGRIKIDTPLFFPNVYLMATPMEFTGTGTKDVDFQFGDVTFNGNVPFTSELKLDHYDVGFYYGIPGLNLATAGILNVDLGLGARIVDFKARVTGQDTVSGLTVTQTESATVPVPLLYLGIQVKPVKWLAVEGEARGITYGSNYYFDISGRAKIKPFGPLFAAAGYRYEKIKIDTNDAKAEASIGGPFGEIGVEF